MLTGEAIISLAKETNTSWWYPSGFIAIEFLAFPITTNIGGMVSISHSQS